MERLGLVPGPAVEFVKAPQNPAPAPDFGPIPGTEIVTYMNGSLSWSFLNVLHVFVFKNMRCENNLLESQPYI